MKLFKDLTASDFEQLLKDLNACNEARLWAKGKTAIEVINDCYRGDWLLWLYKRINHNDIRNLTLAKGHCANTVIHLMKDERSKAAVDAAIKFGNNEIDIEQLNAAYAVADASAYAANASAYAAADASANATYASAYAAADASAYAAADAAANAANAAAYAAYASANATYASAYAAADAPAYAAADAAAYAAYASANAAYASANATYASAYAANAAAYATYASAYAANAAAYAANAAANATKKNNQLLTANICRKYLPFLEIQIN